jgi:hypothetical protein
LVGERECDVSEVPPSRVPNLNNVPCLGNKLGLLVVDNNVLHKSMPPRCDLHDARMSIESEISAGSIIATGRSTVKLSGIEAIGQAFADEIFRVYATDHPEIKLSVANANSQVTHMIARAIAAAKSSER